MPEPLTTQLVAELLQQLLSAFPSRNLASQNIVHTAEVYRNGLRGLSGDALRAAVDRAIQEDEYFPKVARLREIAAKWERYNHVTLPAQANADELWCGLCRQRSTHKERWRPVVDNINRPVLTADQKYVLLERYERLLCACASPPGFTPIENLAPPVASADAMPREMFIRATKGAAIASEATHAA